MWQSLECCGVWQILKCCDVWQSLECCGVWQSLECCVVWQSLECCGVWQSLECCDAWQSLECLWTTRGAGVVQRTSNGPDCPSPSVHSLSPHSSAVLITFDEMNRLLSMTQRMGRIVGRSSVQLFNGLLTLQLKPTKRYHFLMMWRHCEFS